MNAGRDAMRSATWRRPRVLLYFLLVSVALNISFVHLSEIREVEPAQYFAFKAQEPFLSRILLPLLSKSLPINFAACGTGLNFPLQACADVLSLLVDFSALLFSCLVVVATFRRINSMTKSRGQGLHKPELCLPLLLWMVCFCYVLVPNRALYYPYDFFELSLFATAVRLAVASDGFAALLVPLTFLASLNKETALFIPLIYCIYARFLAGLTRTKLISVAAAVLSVPIGKYFCLYYIYGRGAGTVQSVVDIYDYHVLDNLKQLINPLAWLAWSCALGGGFVVLLLPNRAILPLRREVLCLAFLWMAIMFVVGIGREMRLWGPMIFPALLPLSFIVDDWLYSDRQQPL